MSTPMTKKPIVKLIGEDGNAFMIIGLCLRAAKAAGWDGPRRDELKAEMFSCGDYDKLLQIAMKHFEVE